MKYVPAPPPRPNAPRHSAVERLVSGEKTIDGIQVLRAAAAMMVVMHHARHSVSGSDGWPAFGSSGVDVFFVISGFVMAHTTRNLADVGSNCRFRESWLFLRKRAARIIPLYWLAIVWTSRRNMPDLNLMKDFLFIPHLSEQYPVMIWPLVIQGWTLNYEMFFYAMFAITMLFGLNRTVVLLATLIIIPLAIRFLGGNGHVFTRFYSNDIMIEFGFGVVLQRLLNTCRLPGWPRSVFVALFALGFLLLALGNEHHPRSIMQGLPALLVVGASFKACEGWLRFRVLGLLGNASYAIYLFHWAAFGALKPFSGLVGSRQVAVLMVAHVLVAAVAGVVIHLVLERRLNLLASLLLGLSTRTPAPPPSQALPHCQER